MGPKQSRPKPGDVYASPLVDGRYGVVRVLQVLEKSSLIAVPPRQAPSKRHPMLVTKDFWELIGLIDWSKIGHDDAVLAPLVSALTERSVGDILGFDERLADYLYQLDGEVYAREIGEEGYQGPDEFFSVDRFLYVRCCVVANGRAFYMQAKRDASQMPKGLEFESLLYVASKAYEAKTGEDWDHVSYRSYETFSNRAGWAADDT